MYKCKVAIILPAMTIGGAETMAVQLAVNINKDKFDVMLIILYNRLCTQLEEFASDNKLNVKYLNKNKGFSFGAVIELYKLLKSYKPHIIHTHIHSYPYTLLYIFMHRIKLIHTIHNMPIFESKTIGRLILKILFKVRKAKPVAISRIIQNETSNLYRLKFVDLIYNPVDLERFSRKKNQKDEFSLLNVGRLAPQKNQILLIQAIALLKSKYPKIKLFIAGTGPLENELRYEINRLKLDNNIFLLGNISNVEDLMSECTVFILTSIYEGLPMTLLEAMAIGMPIIATRVGGVPDIIYDNGILIDSQDINCLTISIEKMINDKEFRKICSRKSLEYAKVYDIKKIAQQYELLYLKYARRIR